MLGPLLFLVGINYLYYEVGSGVLLFADDTTLFSSHADLHAAVDRTRALFNTSSHWFMDDNKLALSNSKTQEIVFGLDHNAEISKPVKLLRFTLDAKLSLEAHIAQMCIKLSRVIYLLRRLANDLYFFSHVAYGTVLRGNSSGTLRLFYCRRKQFE